MSTLKRTTKTTVASIALAGILALYAGGLAMTVLTSSVFEAFAVSSSDSSSSDSSSPESGDNNKISKSDERQILDGIRQCFDSSNDNRDLEKCLGDTIDKFNVNSNQDQSTNSSSSQ